jgi:putative membrane protein
MNDGVSPDPLSQQQAIRAMAEEAIDPRVDLAVQRTELALERTQLAWIRTAFTFITAGVAIDKATEAMHDARVLAGKNWVQSGHVAGLVLTFTTTLFLILATISYVRQARALERLRALHTGWIPGSLPLSVLVIVLGGSLFLLLMFMN